MKRQGIRSTIDFIAGSGMHVVPTRFGSGLLSKRENPMHKQTDELVKKVRRKVPSVRTSDQQPLLTLLVAEANRRSDPLASMAKALGVTYRRLAQWRRNESLIRNSRRSVFENAAQYLRIPALIVLIHADVVRLSDFLWPGKETLQDYVSEEIKRMQHDKLIGPYVPVDLDTAAPDVRMLMAYLFHEMKRNSGAGEPGIDWLEEIRKEAELRATDGPNSREFLVKSSAGGEGGDTTQ